MSENKALICEVLRLLRIANDLTIKELSDKTGISVSYISEMEKGIKNTPSIDIIEKYSQALDIKKSTIMSIVEDFSNEETISYKKLLLNILMKIFQNS